MEAAPQRPLQDVIEAEADGQLQAGDEPTDFRHTEGNWKKCVRSGAPFSALILTRITARNAKASIDKVMCRYQPCQLRTSSSARPTSCLAASKHSSMRQR